MSDQIDPRALLRALPVAACVLSLDAEPRILAVSSAYVAAAALPEERLVGNRLFETIPGSDDDAGRDSIARLRDSFARVAASGRPDVMESVRYDVEIDGRFVEK